MNRSRPSRFLLTMWEGGGTVPPQLGLARRLIAAGHQVHVLGDPTIGARAEAIGCGFTAWTTAPHRTGLDPDQDLFKDWEVSNPLSMLRNARDRFMAGPADRFAADTTDAIHSVQPDAVLADGLILGSMIAAQAAGIPVAAIMPNIWMIPTPGVPAMGPGFAPAKSILGRTRDAVMGKVATRIFDGGLPALNDARAGLGLDAIDTFWDQVLSCDRIFVLSSAAFDFAAPFVPDHAHYLGPILDDPAWAEPWTAPWPATSSGPEDPLVLVGLSSTFQDQVPLLRRVVEGLSRLPVRAVVTLGQMVDLEEVPGAANVDVVASAPHGPILEAAAVAVTHCGHGTTLKALASGTPLVCIPMGRDQNDTAVRVVERGAGVRLAPKATADDIAAAVRDVLADETYTRRAEALRDAIAEEHARVDVVAEITELVRPVGSVTSGG